MKRKKMIMIWGLLGIAIMLGIIVCFYSSRIWTIASIRKISSNPEYNLYSIDIHYDYDLDSIIATGFTDDQTFVDAITRKALLGLPVQINAPNFGCSAMIIKTTNGEVFTGRNYDFARNTSAMLVRCSPRDGYKSMALCALDNIQANHADQSLRTKLACLISPYLCLDGINEKGVTISVLTLDSEPTHQRTGKLAITTVLAIRLVLDRAASTEEAIALLKKYDMMASAGRDYHFYVTDALGDGCVIEFDCDSPERKLIVTPAPAVTNFFMIHEDKVLPHQRNGIYGHGKERYDAIRNVQQEDLDKFSKKTVWKALQAASQAPKNDDITSNTQWSALYDNKALTLEVSLRRKWDQKFSFSLND